ncbi:hypothetical protein [Geomicrobium sp. JCM 19055]|uniref:hypothetical protein n=1 Tax=Geomicrobium sp. JCM 19055 TaxID=1460649 RepID=UPI00269DAF00
MLAQNPPLPDGSQASTEFLNALYKNSEPDSETELEDDADELISQYMQASDEEKEAKKRKTEAENILKQKLGEYEKGFADRHIVTWKGVTAERFDSKKI